MSKRIEVKFVGYDRKDVREAMERIAKLGNKGFIHLNDIEHPQITAILLTKEPISNDLMKILHEYEIEDDDNGLQSIWNGGEIEIADITFFCTHEEL